MRILALATNPETAASTRFRIVQWRPYLEPAGLSLSLCSFLSPVAAEVMYRPGHTAAKAAYVLAGVARRLATLARASRRADMLFVHREAFPLGCRPFFRYLRRFPGPLVYDYDDAMFLPQRQGRGVLARLEDLETPNELMALSEAVLAGNRFLAEYSRPRARHVVVLPTCIDTTRFRPLGRSDPAGPPVIGWIGSHSTVKYLRSVLPALARVAGGRRFVLYVVGSPEPLPTEGVEVRQASWALDRESADFARCDIGIYPLWDDPWSLGKCGFKAIQFMACAVPVVASAVGVNREIIEDGCNGFLASTEEEWVEKVGLLLSDRRLREKLGQAGRQTVEERYSVKAHAPTLIGALRQAAARSPVH